MTLLFFCESDAAPAAQAEGPQHSAPPRLRREAEVCCSWCRQPIMRCRHSSCDSAGTYSGVLVWGEWRAVDRPEHTELR